ncbi:YjgN family protein [Massilia luteola]|uniref:YjgN family protein n=1 Tax=Massilia luteola TaxID=3081751 RepID=UPI002ACBE71D|nr:YjgN family protein [Massilia sp. Gc5]
MHESPTSPAETPLPFTFSGSGAEYFRIWIVNLLLTVATLGIYSAWAKTRRLRYFYRNTQLAGAAFDFRGDPKAILRGRILAVALLAAYHYAFGFSLKAGVVTVALLLAGLPFMMRSALRFRLANTVYRGLPFGFAGGVKEAYLVYLLPAAIFVLPGALVALMPGRPIAGTVFLLYLCWPLMHGAMKAYQHKHLMAGDQHAAFALGTADLAKPYVRALLIGLGLLVLVGAAFALAVVVPRGHGWKNVVAFLPAIISLVIGYVCLLLSGPYIMVRMNNLAWSATSFPGVRIACAMRVGPYLRLQVANVLLTLLTFGLYRPFAVVRTWKYRVAHVTVEAPDGFEQAVLTARRPPVAAAGDGVADFLGVDLSW